MESNNAKGFLTFTKKEKRGIATILFVVVTMVVCSKYIYPLIVSKSKVADASILLAVDSLKVQQAGKSKNYYNKNDNTKNSEYSTYQKKEYDNSYTGTMFYFDPNTLDTEGWKKLGVRDKTIATIQNYLSKGGKFKTADDIRKIWGLSDDEKDRLVPYARIAEQQNDNTYKSYEKKEYPKKEYEKKGINVVDINVGDTAAFIGLPGIGVGFSKRIIKFRDKLGGFYKVEQVAETFGLPDSTFQKIKPYLKINGANIKKININTATDEELKSHPYIRWQLSKVILEYKKQHGNFNSVEDLKKIMLINEETYNKISPYLTL